MRQSIQKIDLACNHVSIDGALKLAEALCFNHRAGFGIEKRQEIDLRYNKIDHNGRKKVENFLKMFNATEDCQIKILI